MAQATVKITIDVSEFVDFTRKAPGVMDGLTKEAIGRGVAKMRKEFARVIDSGNWPELQETPEYKSKYSKPLQVMKSLIRYRVTGGYKKVVGTVGVFPGKAGRDNLTNAAFKAKYGVTLSRFAQVMTYGGTLRLRPGDRQRLVKQGFHISKRVNVLKFPARNWYTPCRWKEQSVIIPYITADLNKRIKDKLSNGKFYKRLR